MDIGELREQVTIRPLTNDENTLGGFDQSGADGGSIPAKIRLVTDSDRVPFGIEGFAWQQLRQKTLYFITLRYRTDLKTGYVITDGDNIEYYVLAVANPDRLKRWTRALMEEGGPKAV